MIVKTASFTNLQAEAGCVCIRPLAVAALGDKSYNQQKLAAAFWALLS
jgi:hypothetical protein